MRERDYLRKRQELQADYKKKIEALETVWKLFNPDAPLPYDQEVEESTSSNLDWSFEISKKMAVQRAAQALDSDFSIEDVRKGLEAMNRGWSNGISDTQLSSIVSKAASDGRLEIIRSKVGRSPAIYRNPTDVASNDGDEVMTLDT